MVIELSKSVSQPPCINTEKKYSDSELQNMLIGMMNENGVNPEGINVKDEGTIEVDEAANFKLHRIMLKAEEMGLSIRYTKKTIIEVC
ncbi:MAG: hypothetical protein AB8G22_06570 [Saprospiraceae bacterium]